MKNIIHSENAPKAIGPYSQAVQAGQTIYFSGQIPLDPVSMVLVEGNITKQAHQVFKNLKAVCEAAKGNFTKIVKLTIYLTDLDEFSKVNEVMQEYFTAPFPARTTIQVAALPKNAEIEIDAIMVL
jgi:reactive intermediate/imine deaminase